MVTITHYEVYSQSSSNWRLEERFPADQRDRAFDLCKKLEKKNIPVRIIRESFDVENNRYMESVEYVSGIANKGGNVTSGKKKKGASRGKVVVKNDKNISKQVAKPTGKQNIASAIVTIIAIILFCLVFANLFVTLLTPVIEEFLPEHKRETTLSVLFFCLFLFTAIPLVIRKVPWYVFDATGITEGHISERKIYSSADTIIRRYRLNDDVDPSIAPITPEAPLAYKRYIVEFLSQVINNISDIEKFSTNYNRLGVKLVVFGGCLELSRKANLSITEANSLLYEAFQIIDGENADLEGFYEAKRAYNENKNAIFLTGVGAYMMSRLLKDKLFNPDIIKKAFKRWTDQDANNVKTGRAKPKFKNSTLKNPFECVVNIQSIISRIDEFDEVGGTIIPQIESLVENIIKILGDKFEASDVSLFDGIISLKFSSLANALDFSIRFFKDFDKEVEDISDENLNFNNKINILTYKDLYEEDSREVVLDVFDNSYNDEIIIKDEVKEKLENFEYKFEYLGAKKLGRSLKIISLYKVIYQ